MLFASVCAPATWICIPSFPANPTTNRVVLHSSQRQFWCCDPQVRLYISTTAATSILMHLSISCPIPHPPGIQRVWQIKLSKCPTPGGQFSCQIPTISQAFVGDFASHFGQYWPILTSNSGKCNSMPLKATATKIGKKNLNLNVNCPRDGDKCWCQIPAWGVGMPGS